jgi:hypothetical protein
MSEASSIVLYKLIDISFIVAGILMLLNYHQVSESLFERRRNFALNRMLGFRYGPAQFRMQVIVVVFSGAAFIVGGLAEFLGWIR